jgi:hypothetical protein
MNQPAKKVLREVWLIKIIEQDMVDSWFSQLGKWTWTMRRAQRFYSESEASQQVEAVRKRIEDDELIWHPDIRIVSFVDIE